MVGLDYHDAALDVHELLQRMKLHPFFRRQLEGGQLLEWGAKTIPEGGYYSLPERRYGDGILLAGDAAGFVDVPSLKGIHYAMQSGIFAARAAFAALKAGDVSARRARSYDRMVDDSYIAHDLLSDPEHAAGVQGRILRGRGQGRTDDAHRRPLSRRQDRHAGRCRGSPRGHGPHGHFTPDNRLTFSKLDAVFKSGNATRDTIPSHLLVGQDITAEVADFYSPCVPGWGV